MGGARVALGVVLFWLHHYGICWIWLVLGVVLWSCSHCEGLKSPLAPQEQRRRWSWRRWLCGWCERRLVVHHLFEFCFFPCKFFSCVGFLVKGPSGRVKAMGGRGSRPIRAHFIGVRVARPIGAKRVPNGSTCHVKYNTSNDVFSRCKCVHKMATGKSDDQSIQPDNKLELGTSYKLKLGPR